MQRATEDVLQRLAVAVRRPQLEFRIAGRPQADQIRVSPGYDVERSDDLRVAPVESFRQPQHRGQRPDGPPEAALEQAVAVVRFLRRGLAMVARQQRDDLDLLRIEPAQLSVLDQVIRMAMMAFVADVDARVVQEGAVFEPLAFAIAQLMDRASLIEDRHRQLRDVARMRRVVAAALPELDDAATPDVGIALDLPYGGGVAVDVVEDQPFTQGEAAQRDVLSAQAPQDAIEQYGAGDRDIGPARFEPVHVQTSFKIRADQPFAQLADGLRGDAAVPGRLITVHPVLAEGQRTEAQDRPRCADDAIEPTSRDVVQVVADLLVDVFDQPPFVAA